eukprot:6701966-Prymnesium_polylepis.1
MASVSSPPVQPAAAPRLPSSPHCHAASTIRSADSQSHSTSTLSPSRCLASVRSIATSSAIWLDVPGGSAPSRVSVPSHVPHAAADPKSQY